MNIVFKKELNGASLKLGSASKISITGPVVLQPFANTIEISSSASRFPIVVETHNNNLTVNDVLQTLNTDNEAICDKLRDEVFPNANTSSGGSGSTELTNYYTKSQVDTKDANTISSLRANVPVAGDNLNKLYNLIAAVNTLLTSDDVNFDTLQEVVNGIKADEGLITSLTTNKVSVSDILNALTQTTAGKVLDARQGKVLNDAIATLQASVTANTMNITAKADKDAPASIAFASNLNIDLSNSATGTIPVTGNITLTPVNMTNGSERTYRLKSNGSSWSISLPAGVTGIPSLPSGIAANKVMYITFKAYGTALTDVDVFYNVQS